MKKLLNLDHKHFNNIFIFQPYGANYIGFPPRVWLSDLNVTARTLSGMHVWNLIFFLLAFHLELKKKSIDTIRKMLQYTDFFFFLKTFGYQV